MTPVRRPEARQLPLFATDPAPGGPRARTPPGTDAAAGETSNGLRPDPPDAAERAHAVDPSQHVVLEASAGTGKTSVLVQRYCNLLAAGVDPGNILAITFTRKAAAEMRERILRELRRESSRLAAGRRRWLELRDRVADIAISTIDAFCLALLREFPLEADLDPAFRVADDTEVARLMERALDHALRAGRAIAAEDETLALVLTQIGMRQLRAGLRHLLDRRSVALPALAGFIARAGAPASAADAVDRALDTVRQAMAALPGGAPALLDTGPAGSSRFRLLRREVREWLAGRLEGAGDRRRVVESLADYFLTQKGEPRVRGPFARRQFRDDDARRRHQAAFDALSPVVTGALDRLDRDVNAVLARGVQRLAAIAHDAYLRSLEDDDVLDFTETLERAVGLLEQMDEFSRSRFRLESRYHHVLVDEFQDTSRLQWRLVSLLVEAWRAGEGPSADTPLPPTVFIVGDRKQSIYRFRDAEVAILDEASTHIAALRPGARPRRAITTSFRSPATLLAFVNDLFDAVEKAPQRSDAFRYDQRDRFPVLDEPWAAPLDGHRPLGLAVGPTPAETAARVADEIVRLVSAGAQVRDRDSGVPRAVRPGDIAILFRSRESHREYEAALAARRVPTYVYKGLGFFGSDEIQDLSALIRFLAQPDAPAREAALLRSRFVRLSDAALVETAGDLGRVLRSPVELPSFDRLDPADRVVLDRARRAARAWLALADRVPPADLVDAILRDTAYAFEIRGARYAQARENVKKFRALLRRVQNRGYATLGRIADHLDRLSAGDESNAAIDALNAVNLMTVHASKGLEFPVVFVVNLTRGTGTSGPPVRVYADDGQGRPAVSVGTLRFEADEEEKRRDREETKRLLYVAVTRARDRLYLATALGADGRLVAAPGSLAEVLPRSFSAVFGTAVDGEATLEWRGATRVHTFRRVPEARELVELPPESPAAVAIDLLRPVAATPLVHATTVRAAARAERPWSPGPPWEGGHAGDTLTGRLVHRLFQWFDPSGPPGPGESTAGVRDGGGLDGSGVPSLPDRPGGQSGGTGRPPIDNESLLRVARRLVLDEEHAAAGDLEEILRSACATWRALRGRPDVESLFAGARASYEVPFSLCLGGPGTGETLHVVRGTIDCLIERPGGEVVVVEVKSGRPAAWHHDQLALYVRAAQALMPGARVTGVLLGPAR